MNKIQRIIFVAVGIILAAMLVFPPYVFQGGGYRRNEGYSFIFAPPHFGNSAATIDISTLCLQFFVIIFLAAALYFALNTKVVNQSVNETSAKMNKKIIAREILIFSGAAVFVSFIWAGLWLWSYYYQHRCGTLLSERLKVENKIDSIQLPTLEELNAKQQSNVGVAEENELPPPPPKSLRKGNHIKLPKGFVLDSEYDPLALLADNFDPDPILQELNYGRHIIQNNQDDLPIFKRLSIDQFARRIKSKYPEYTNVYNPTLVQNLIGKYPIYEQDVILPNGKFIPPKDAKSISDPFVKFGGHEIIQSGSLFKEDSIKETLIKPLRVKYDKINDLIGKSRGHILSYVDIMSFVLLAGCVLAILIYPIRGVYFLMRWAILTVKQD